MSGEMERSHLGQTNRHIEEATRRIARQELLIVNLERDGRETCRHSRQFTGMLGWDVSDAPTPPRPIYPQ